MTLKDISATMTSGGKAGEHAELLGGSHVGRPRGDGDAGPDRPASEQRREEKLDEQVGALEHGRGGAGLGEDRRDAEEDAEDQIGDAEGGDEHRQGLADEELLAVDGGDENRLDGALLAPLDERGDLGADLRPAPPMRVGPFPGDEASVPPQDGAWSDQAVRRAHSIWRVSAVAGRAELAGLVFAGRWPGAAGLDPGGARRASWECQRRERYSHQRKPTSPTSEPAPIIWRVAQPTQPRQSACRLPDWAALATAWVAERK